LLDVDTVNEPDADLDKATARADIAALQHNIIESNTETLQPNEESDEVCT
jgi:hypothetical protein